MDMDEDVATKRPRMSEPSKEIVDIEDDDERTINKGKATIVEEESQEQSQSVSNIERTITNPTNGGKLPRSSYGFTKVYIK